MFVNRVEPILNFNYWPKPGILFHPFLILFFLYYYFSLHLLFKAYRSSNDIKKNQIKFLLIGIFITYTGACTNFLLWYDIPIPPFGNIGALGYIIFTAYVIFRYNFLITPAVAAKNIIKTMSDYLVVCDINNNIILLNDRALDILKYKNRELLNNNLKILFLHPYDIENKIGKLTATKHLMNYNTHIIDKNMVKIPVSVNISYLTGALNRHLGYIISMRDVSDIEKFTNQLKSKTKILEKKTLELKKSNSELSRFNNLAVNRELVMINMKKEITELKNELAKYTNKDIDK